MNRRLALSILILTPLLSLGALFGYLRTQNQLPTDRKNPEGVPLAFQDNTVQCPTCHMYLVGKKHTAQIIQNAKTYFFDDVGCAVLWMKAQNVEPSRVRMWVFSNDTNRYVDALRAFYSVTDETPMHYGFGAYEQQGEYRITFDEMRLRMLRGETMSDPKIRKKLLGK